MQGETPKPAAPSPPISAFGEAVIRHQQPPRIAEEGYYASMLCLLGDEAMQQGRTLSFPEEFKLDYLNHKAPQHPL